MAQSVKVSINLNSDQVLDYYRGKRDRVRAKTSDGSSVSIPYNILLEFVTREGIYGTFEITYGNDGKFQTIHRVK